MLTTIINPLPLVFTLATAFGVLVHDTQLDRAATIAIAIPAALATYATVDSAIKSSEHIHVERVSLGHHLSSLKTGTPRLQPRDDERRYHQMKRLQYSTGDSVYLWPSV